MRLLLTAFEPFGGSAVNASLEACRVFLERWGGAYDLRFEVLPVEYDRDTEAVERALAGFAADTILHTGQAGGTAALQVERLAVNVRYGANEPGATQQLIEPGGPAGLFSTHPVDVVAAAINGADVPAVISNHAGIYLCNHVLYRSLRRAEVQGSGTRVGFLHVPCLPEQASGGSPSLPADAVARGIRSAVRALAATAGR